MRRPFLAFMAVAGLAGSAAAESAEEVVSFQCALAIDAVLAELDTNSTNVVIQDALSTIDDTNGQLVCIPISADEIQVRMQSTDMGYSDNRLVFSLDAKTYVVQKTFYGREPAYCTGYRCNKAGLATSPWGLEALH